MIAAAISIEIVNLYARLHGRGPSATTTICDEDVVICVLGGIFTADERALVASDDFELVRRRRLGRRPAAEPTLRALIETITARPVQAYMSEVGPEGLAFETFVLDPN